MLAGILQFVKPLLLFAGQPRLTDQISHAGDGIKRCPYFVAHIGHKRALGDTRSLSGFHRDLELDGTCLDLSFKEIAVTRKLILETLALGNVMRDAAQCVDAAVLQPQRQLGRLKGFRPACVRKGIVFFCSENLAVIKHTSIILMDFFSSGHIKELAIVAANNIGHLDLPQIAYRTIGKQVASFAILHINEGIHVVEYRQQLVFGFAQLVNRMVKFVLHATDAIDQHLQFITCRAGGAIQRQVLSQIFGRASVDMTGSLANVLHDLSF